jgi:hypothetical protein
MTHARCFAGVVLAALTLGCAAEDGEGRPVPDMLMLDTEQWLDARALQVERYCGECYAGLASSAQAECDDRPMVRDCYRDLADDEPDVWRDFIACRMEADEAFGYCVDLQIQCDDFSGAQACADEYRAVTADCPELGDDMETMLLGCVDT